jgi:hypothetical protein
MIFLRALVSKYYIFFCISICIGIIFFCITYFPSIKNVGVGVVNVLPIEAGPEDKPRCTGNDVPFETASSTQGLFMWVVSDRAFFIPATSRKIWFKRSVCHVDYGEDVVNLFFVKEIKNEQLKLLADGFVKDVENTSTSTSDLSFGDYTEGYIKGDRVCGLSISSDNLGVPGGGFGYYMDLVCGVGVAHYAQQALPLYDILGITNKSRPIHITKIDSGFISGQTVLGLFLVKKEGDSYHLLFKDAEIIDCSLAKREHVPPLMSGCR